MKRIETEKFIYTREDIVVGDKKRNIILINKKPDAKLGSKKMSQGAFNALKSATFKNKKAITIGKKSCRGCSRRRKA